MMLPMASARAALRHRLPCRRPVSLYVKPTKTPLNSLLQVSDEVREALHGAKRKPVVALETTIYTHGFPYPDNVALASHLESVVRTNGGVPATIGILDGVARVGMDPEELIRIAASAGKEGTLKVSRRDLAYACGMRFQGPDQGKFTGGTTVAGTMVLAHLAGIKVFGTGGLGGVHRGAESSMDISADLTELGRTPVAVVSSGCKSFLDIPKTLEYLETQGVAVATFADGRSGPIDFPGFWSRESGITSPQVIQDEKQAAGMIYAHHSFPLSSGLLLANPIPSSMSIPKTEIDTIINDAVAEAEVLGISGSRNTPFILAKIKELTQGKSIPANRALIASNIERATNVAKELLLLEQEMQGREPEKSHNIPISSVPSPTTLAEATENQTSSLLKGSDQAEVPTDSGKADVVVTGAVAIDFACNYIPPAKSAPGSVVSPQLHTSNQASIQQTLGGVAHNIALAACLAGSSVRLCSAVGDDVMGRVALDLLRRSGLSTNSVVVRDQATGARTGQYIAINDANKNLTLGMADMDIIQQTCVDDVQAAFNCDLRTLAPRWVVADANWSPKMLHAWLRAGKAAGAHTAFEPVSAVKSTRLFDLSSTNTIKAFAKAFPLFPRALVDLATPNAIELSTMWQTARAAELFSSPAYWAITNAFNLPASGATMLLTQATSPELVKAGVPQQALQLLPLVPTILTTLGPQGVLLTMLLRADDARLRDPDALPHILSRSGYDTGEGGSVGGVYMRLFEPEEVLPDGAVVSVNGVGDTFTGVLVAGLSRGKSVEEMVPVAQRAAVMSLRSESAVSEEVKEIGKFF